MNSLPPYNGSVSCPSVGSFCPSTAGSASLFSFIPFTPGTSFPACGTGVTPCATFSPQGIQPDAKTPAVQEWNLSVEQQLNQNTSLRVAYVGSFAIHELLSIDPNSIPAQICSNPAGMRLGRHAGHHKGQRPSRCAIYPCPVQTQPSPFRRILLVHRGQQQLQRFASRRHPPHEQRPGISRKLYLVQKPGYEFRSHHRAGEQSAATGAGSQRSCAGIGDRPR